MRPLPFVGRDAVLGEISAALAAPRGGLILLTGPAGAGKTRIAAEVADQAEGYRVVWSWCHPAGSVLEPWAQILRDLDASLSTAAQATDPDGARRQLTGNIASVLRANAPLLIVLDDVHDADASSLRLLTELVATARTSKIVFLATARDDDLAWQDRVAARAALHGQATSLPVGPLSRTDIGALVESATGRRPLEDEVSSIFARTGGEAFYVTELIRYDQDLPSSVRTAVAARLSALSPKTAQALTTAAVLGVRFGLDVLAEVLTVDIHELRAMLADAASAGLLARVEPGSASFPHQLLRDAAYQSLPPDERASVHLRTAEVLARQQERNAQVAHHLLSAGPEHTQEAAEYAWQAGDDAARLLAYDDAVTWYTRAAETIRAPELLVALGTARLGTGDREGARADFLRAATVADDRPDLLARAALGLGSFEVDLLDRAQVDLLERARAQLVEGELKAMVTARLSIATSLIEPEERRIALAEEALRIARDCDSPSAIGQALAAMCDARPGPDFCADRLAWSGEIIAVARAIRDPGLELLGRRLRVVALLETGGQADAEMLAFETTAKPLDQPQYEWFVPLWRGMRALAEKRYDDCRTFLAQTEELGRQAGSPNAAMLAGTQRWYLLTELGDLDAVDVMVEEFGLEQIGGVWPRVTMALIAARAGRLEEARARLSTVAGLLATAPRDSEWLPMLAQLAEFVALTGPHPVAAQVREWLEPYADLQVVEGIGAVVRGPVRDFLALLGAPAASGNVFRRDGDIWLVAFGGEPVRLTASKGLQDIARLLAQPGREIAAADLAGSVVSSASTGEVLDATARAAYKQRLVDLTAAAEEADFAGDAERSARIAAERDALITSLTSAYGLGGRVRRTGSSAERARSAVTARIRSTIDRIGKVHPALGRHLASSVRTGTFCVYDPETPQTWDLTL